MTLLSIVIPSHNRADLLRACLKSVQHNAPPQTQLIVVDDASPDCLISRTVNDFPGVEVLRLPQRGGFCVAANAGIHAARHPIIELLNDDTEVCPGWAAAAVAAFTDPTIAAVAPLVLRWPDGQLIDSAGDGYHLGGYAAKLCHDQPLTAQHQRGRFVFGASGSSAFYRRETLQQVGGFPESFGAYFEDVDLSFRLQNAGWRIWFEPNSRVLHHVSASHGARPSPALLEQQSRNEELVFWRNLPALQLLAALPLHGLVLCAKAWRRWRQGELLPFLRGRLSAWIQWRAVARHRLAMLRNRGEPAT